MQITSHPVVLLLATRSATPRHAGGFALLDVSLRPQLVVFLSRLGSLLPARQQLAAAAAAAPAAAYGCTPPSPFSLMSTETDAAGGREEMVIGRAKGAASHVIDSGGRYL